MKVIVFCVGFLIALGGIDVFAQAITLSSPPDLQIVKYSWSKDRIDWERDLTPAESYRETTYRIRNERRTGTPLEERDKISNREAQKEQTKPPRYAFTYKLQVNNTGTKTIKEIDWDYIFTDETTGEELGRREFTSVEKIGPGKRKELIVKASAAPASRVSVYSLGKNEKAGMVEKVRITRLLYDDNTSVVLQDTKGP